MNYDVVIFYSNGATIRFFITMILLKKKLASIYNEKLSFYSINRRMIYSKSNEIIIFAKILIENKKINLISNSKKKKKLTKFFFFIFSSFFLFLPPLHHYELILKMENRCGFKIVALNGVNVRIQKKVRPNSIFKKIYPFFF